MLTDRLASRLAAGWRLLDVGCGDGRLGALLRDAVPEFAVQGVEVLPRPIVPSPVGLSMESTCHLRMVRSIAACLWMCCTTPRSIAAFARCVPRQFTVLTDQGSRGGDCARWWTLRLMDWIGNGLHGVALPYNYLSRSKWQNLYSQLGLTVERTDNAIPLYPFPFSRPPSDGICTSSPCSKKRSRAYRRTLEASCSALARYRYGLAGSA